MNININNKNHKIIFGVGFVRTLDEKYFITNKAGIKFGVGLSQRIPALLTHNPVALSEFLYEGTCTEDERPTQKEIDAYIDNCEDIEALFDEVISELKKSNATKNETLEAIKAVAEAEKENPKK